MAQINAGRVVQREKPVNTAEEKVVIYQNKITMERLVCNNVRFRRYIDGAHWLSVRRENEDRYFLIREDALTRIV